MTRLEKLSGSTGVILIGFATFVLMSREDAKRSRQERILRDRTGAELFKPELKITS